VSDDEPVPKLPRGRGLRLNGPEVFRVLITGAMLVAVLILAKPCGDAVSRFVMGMDGSGKGSAIPKPGNVDIPQLPGSADDYVELHPGMTDEQVKEAIERAKAKSHARDSAGSAARAVGSAATAPAGSAAPAGSTAPAGSAASSKP
jgi:hypothetical protein